MSEFVLSAWVAGGEAAEMVDHETSNIWVDPDVAVNNPDYVTLCFAISSTHISDLGIRPQVVCFAMVAREIGIFLLDEDLGVKG